MNTPNFPVLKTERLTLRQLSTKDRHDILTLRSDPEINKYLGRKSTNTEQDALNFIKKVNDNFEKSIALYWTITLTNTKTFVGTICIFNFSKEESSCEIGFELLTNYQGQGIMTDAAEAVIGYVFQGLKFNKIRAFTHCNNKNSTRLLTKLNFVKSTKTDNEKPEEYIFTLTKTK
jgi:[ribosomal protein S5]-alanine N-acetyltransferase